MADEKKAAEKDAGLKPDTTESAGDKKLAQQKADDQMSDAAAPLADPLEPVDVGKAAKDLPVYDEQERILRNHEVRGRHSVVPDTPSGYALKKIGNLDGEDVDHSKPGATEAALAHGEEYQRIKSGVRHGYIVPGEDD